MAVEPPFTSKTLVAIYLKKLADVGMIRAKNKSEVFSILQFTWGFPDALGWSKKTG